MIMLNCSAAIARALGAEPYRPGQKVPGAHILITADDGSLWLWRIQAGALQMRAS